MRSTKLSSYAIVLALVGLVIFSCSRKGDDPVPEKKGNLRVAVMVDDETGRLGDQFLVRISLFDDTLHQYEVDSKQISLQPGIIDSIDFTDINARAAFYYIEFKAFLDFQTTIACDDTPVFVEDGVTRRVGIEMLNRFIGVSCSQF